MKRDSFRDLTHTNKMFDFIAMRRPVIVSRTASVEAYFDESCFQLFDSEDDRDLARADSRAPCRSPASESGSYAGPPR